jgi:hypothetical protein
MHWRGQILNLIEKPTLIDKGFGSKTVFTPIKNIFFRKQIKKVLFCSGSGGRIS